MQFSLSSSTEVSYGDSKDLFQVLNALLALLKR